jgi:ABC-2 type transport system ATP-binding protein
MSNSAVAASGLRKAYGDKTVLDGIDLNVRAGTVFSLLGQNGAGKTTTVNVLTTLVRADGGTVRVAGHGVATQPKAVRAAVGVTGQFAAVDELLTGQENLQLMADLKHVGAREGRRVVTELLARFGQKHRPRPGHRTPHHHRTSRRHHRNRFPARPDGAPGPDPGPGL